MVEGCGFGGSTFGKASRAGLDCFAGRTVEALPIRGMSFMLVSFFSMVV